MTAKSRKILFFVFVCFFFMAAPTIILYSQGYRLSIPSANGKYFVKTGGLFVKTYPKQTDIYINGNLSKKTDIFFGSSLIENLLPKKYKIEVRKEGYYTWQKELAINEKEVTEAKYVVLFPQNPAFDVAAEGASNFWPSPDGKKIILYENPGGNWSLKLYDVDKGLKSQLADESDISVDGANLTKVEWSSDSKAIDLSVNLRSEQRNYTLSVERPSPQLIRKNDPSLVPQNILAFEKTPGAIYYLDQTGFVYKKDPATSEAAKINEKSFPQTKGKDYQIWVLDNELFVAESQNLYFYNPKAGDFEKIFENLASDLKLSPDGGKVAYFSNSELWVFFLKDSSEEPRKSAGDKLFIVRLSEKIQDCAWLNPDYLVFSSGGNVKISEIDSRDRLNMIDLVKFTQPGNDTEQKQTLFWDNNSRSLYVLNNGNLYKAAVD